MALVQQKLYQSKDLSRINLKNYIIDLAGFLVSGYGISPEKIQLDLDDMEDVTIQLDSAIPCGLILNELITNFLKYAFPGEDSLNAHYRLGLKTVASIGGHQFAGRVSFFRHPGFTCNLRFSEAPDT